MSVNLVEISQSPTSNTNIEQEKRHAASGDIENNFLIPQIIFIDLQVETEVAILVGTQMGFCVLGVFLNNVAFITLKDLPGVRASTYNILICHVVLGIDLNS